MKKHIFILLLGLLASCEYQGDYYFKIDNESEYNIQCVKTASQKTDTFTVDSGTEELIHFKKGFNGMRDLNDEFLKINRIDTIYFLPIQDSLEVNLNPMIRESWIYNTEPNKKDKDGKPGKCFYILKIDNSQIK